jgi:hypothetical protein
MYDSFLHHYVQPGSWAHRDLPVCACRRTQKWFPLRGIEHLSSITVANNVTNFCTWIVSNTTKHTLSVANSRLIGKEILHILLNPKIHYLVHNSLLLVSILSQMNSLQILTFYFCMFFYLLEDYSQKFFGAELVFNIGRPFEIKTWRAFFKNCPKFEYSSESLNLPAKLIYLCSLKGNDYYR